jgi:hypothetical protein
MVLAVSLPFALAIGFGAFSGGCGPSTPDTKTPPKGTSSITTGSPDAGGKEAAPVDAMVPAPEAATDGPIGVWPVDAAEAGLALGDGATDAPAGAPCWKGFTTSGNAVSDLDALGKRCTGGMTPLVGPVKQVFKQGEVKTIPVAFVPACYRIIAVGGTGLKDVDLELKDASGKMVAADNTPNDVFPMIHPNKEFCVDAVQFLNLSIIVKKGSGEVAGAVWKR